MENTLQRLFNFESFEVRTIVNETGKVWFVGKDVAEILGYSNTRDALAKHVDEEDKATVAIHDGSQNRNMIAINESGIYSLIMSSTLSAAKTFKHWVTHDVLPAIRKQGFYSIISDEELLDVLSERVKNKPQLVDRAFVAQKERNTFKRYVADKEIADLWKQRKEISPTDYEERLAEICNGNVSRYTKEYNKYLKWRDSYRTLKTYAESRELI